jgi:hypothetical protein
LFTLLSSGIPNDQKIGSRGPAGAGESRRARKGAGEKCSETGGASPGQGGEGSRESACATSGKGGPGAG